MSLASRLLGLALAAWLVGVGAWAYLLPASFGGQVATFPPYNQHLIHDLGAFQIGLGAMLLISLPSRAALASAFAANLVAGVLHVIAHVEDRALGGHWYDIPVLSVIALVALLGLLLTAAARWRCRARGST